MIREKTKRVVDEFVERLKEHLGENLVSVMLYGSAAGETYLPGASDINLLVVTQRLGPEEIELARTAVSRRLFRHRIKPVFFSREFLESSADAFAVEWAEIKTRRQVLWGTDPAAALTVRPEDIRLQLEREIKQNLLRFQQGLLLGARQPGLLRDSVRPLQVALRNLAAYRGSPPPVPEWYEELLNFAGGTRRLTRARTRELLGQYLVFLQKLVQLVNAR